MSRGALAALFPLGCNLHGIRTDGHGLDPAHLKHVLSTWDPSKSRPKMLYLIPNGGNPTGSTLTLERKKAIYQLAREHDLIIIEDDPYYFLQFGPKAPSFFSMDEDARVVRLDSFSKVVSSGLRIGFATGPKPLIERIQLHGQASSLHPSGLSQAALLAYLNHVGQDGFVEHTLKVAKFYEGRRDVFCRAASRHLKGLVEMVEPSAGARDFWPSAFPFF